MKVQRPTGMYTVSFNCRFGDFICGDEDMYTVDFVGDDVDELIQEVLNDNPSYPLVFVRNQDTESTVIGHFRSVDEDDEYCDAVLVHSSDM